MKYHFGCIVLAVLFISALSSAAAESLTAREVVHLQREARELMKTGECKKAGRLYGKLEKQAVLPEQKAYYLLYRSECCACEGSLQEAREGFELLLKKYPYYIPYERVLEDLRLLAAKYEAGEGTFLGLKDEEAAINVYRMILGEHVSMQKSLPDRLKYAELLQKTGRREEAAAVYFEILKKLPDQVKIRYLYIRLLAKISEYGDGDGSKLRAVRREMKVFLKQISSEDPRFAEITALSRHCDEVAASRVLTQAEFYLLKHYRRPEIARRYLHDVIREFPETAVARKAKEILEREFPQVDSGK